MPAPRSHRAQSDRDPTQGLRRAGCSPESLWCPDLEVATVASLASALWAQVPQAPSEHNTRTHECQAPSVVANPCPVEGSRVPAPWPQPQEQLCSWALSLNAPGTLPSPPWKLPRAQ